MSYSYFTMRNSKVFSQSPTCTKKIAKTLARDLGARLGPIVIALKGNLGAGKTTFTQGFASALGIKEKILSPTFVLMKIYKIFSSQIPKKHLIHVDCYRLDSPKEMEHLGFKNFIKDKDAVIIIEWADRIKRLLPKEAVWIRFSHGKKQTERKIIIRPTA